MDNIYIKFLKDNYDSQYAGSNYVKYLPKEDGRAGNLTRKVRGNLRMCRCGYHLTYLTHAVDWLNRRAFLAVPYGEIEYGNDKIVCTQVRLIKELDHWYHHGAYDLIDDIHEIYKKSFPELRDDSTHKDTCDALIHYLRNSVRVHSRKDRDTVHDLYLKSLQLFVDQRVACSLLYRYRFPGIESYIHSLWQLTTGDFYKLATICNRLGTQYRETVSHLVIKHLYPEYIIQKGEL